MGADQRSGTAQLFEHPVYRGLHLLLARLHLDMAGKRLITREELALAEDITAWWEKRR